MPNGSRNNSIGEIHPRPKGRGLLSQEKGSIDQEDDRVKISYLEPRDIVEMDVVDLAREMLRRYLRILLISMESKLPPPQGGGFRSRLDREPEVTRPSR